MRLYVVPFLAFLVIGIAIDGFIFKKLKNSSRWPRWAAPTHLALAAMLCVVATVVAATPLKRVDNDTMVCCMYLIYGYYAVTIIKWVALGIYALSWIRRLKPWAQAAARGVSLAVALALALTAVKGMLVTPYTSEVKEVSIEFADLPPAFDGYRIVQFSDTHLGFYRGDTTFISECVDKMNALHPDLICFTGDLVSRTWEEAKPFVPVLSRLIAPDGVVSERGNHDEGDYYDWPDSLHVGDRYPQLAAIERAMGWEVLDNSHKIIKRGKDELVVMGVIHLSREHPPTDDYLAQAYPTYHDKTFKILLQHNPNEWRTRFQKRAHIQLMLAGHTHALQMAINLWGHRLSPARWLYKEWGGLYHDRASDEYLYTNIGLGQVGIPARIGDARPEITVITLKRKR